MLPLASPITRRSAILMMWTALTIACATHDEQAAVFRVHVGHGVVYFKRRVWGLHGSAIALSASPDTREIGTAADYVWGADEPPILLIRIDAETLHLFGNGTGTWQAPSTGSFPVSVVFNEVDVMTLARMAEKPQNFGLRRIGEWQYQDPPVEPVDY